jgi:hypothetical protein
MRRNRLSLSRLDRCRPTLLKRSSFGPRYENICPPTVARSGNHFDRENIQIFRAAGRAGHFCQLQDRLSWLGQGRATVENGKGGGLELVHRIERVIVHPDHAESEGV